MRDKEAIENERKNISRNLEKQTKVLERLQESEKNLTQQVVRISVWDENRILSSSLICRAISKGRLYCGNAELKSLRANAPL